MFARLPQQAFVTIFPAVALAAILGTPALCQIDPDNRSTRSTDLTAEYMEREKGLLEAMHSVLKRRDDIEKKITELYADRNRCDEAVAKLKDEIRRVQIQLLQ